MSLLTCHLWQVAKHRILCCCYEIKELLQAVNIQCTRGRLSSRREREREKKKEKEKESEWQRGWAQNCLYVSCQPSQSAALLSVGQAGSQSVWCRHARKLRPTLCALAISASSDRFTRSVVPTTKFRCFSWCSLPVRIGLSFWWRVHLLLVYARELDPQFILGCGIWVMLVIWF